MTQLPQKTRVRRAEAPRSSGYKEFTSRNYTFSFSSDLKDWMGKSLISKRAKPLF